MRMMLCVYVADGKDPFPERNEVEDEVEREGRALFYLSLAAVIQAPSTLLPKAPRGPLSQISRGTAKLQTRKPRTKIL